MLNSYYLKSLLSLYFIWALLSLCILLLTLTEFLNAGFLG